jgi:hypothetical protein
MSTYTFNLDLGDAIEEAFERAGSELKSGYDYRTARRSLNLMFLEWQNRGLNLWTIKEGTQALTAGTSRYTLDSKILDIVEAFIRTDSGNTSRQVDQMLTRISVKQYAHLSHYSTGLRKVTLEYFLIFGLCLTRHKRIR